jgi:CRISPR/Cas system endoribonuclease Cas6 (RAMP superfamily)
VVVVLVPVVVVPTPDEVIPAPDVVGPAPVVVVSVELESSCHRPSSNGRHFCARVVVPAPLVVTPTPVVVVPVIRHKADSRNTRVINRNRRVDVQLAEEFVLVEYSMSIKTHLPISPLKSSAASLETRQ